ncbi:MAG: FAD-dependent oxidoreductase, partial [Candidatus Edwardsbacteria bacterium]|nr:FAD-dependent oxidoreductase [Candidatus Edwardsbacteria bacterium]
MPESVPSKGHVLVIGGGATGALVSVNLVQEGYRVTAIEKSNQLGNGASSRSAACIRAQFGTPETVLGMRYSEWYFDRFFDLMDVPVDQRDWMIKKNGYLWLYEDPDKYRDPRLHAEALASWEQAQANVKM